MDNIMDKKIRSYLQLETNERYVFSRRHGLDLCSQLAEAAAHARSAEVSETKKGGGRGVGMGRGLRLSKHLKGAKARKLISPITR